MARKAAAQLDPKIEMTPQTEQEEERLPLEDIEVSVSDSEEEPVESQAEVPTTPPVKEPSVEPAEDAKKVAALQQRLAEMEQAEELNRRRNEETQKQLTEAQRGQRQSQWEAWEARKTE